MSSSVSSERAFSQGGITISKRRNGLKGDIVEALLCTKGAIRNDLLFKEPAPSSILEAKEDNDEEPENAHTGKDSEEPVDAVVAGNEELDIEEFSWEELVIDDEDEEGMYCSE